MSYRQEEIEDLVRQVVARTLGSRSMRVIVNEELVRATDTNSTLVIPPEALVTPLARQLALERHITILTEGNSPAGDLQGSGPNPALLSESWKEAGGGTRVVALGADHGGFELKERLKETVSAVGHGLIDCGTHSTASVDYPDYAYAVAKLVADGRAWRGIIIDGAGIGSCMAANKVPGVRAAMCYDQATAVNSREHNNANVLTLGAGLIGPNLATQIVQTWLTTEFGGGRHARRVDKIDAIGSRFTKKER